MIYLDVTSACRSALNTGVKRIQRGMHASLLDHPDYRPVCWQTARKGYRKLRGEDRRLLEGGSAPQGRSALFDSFAPGLWRDWLQSAQDETSMLEWPKNLRAEDLLLIPDLVWDNRGAFLAQLPKTAARRIGVFHDAIALRLPRQSRIDRYFCRRGIHALAALDGVLCISQEAEVDLQTYWRDEGLRAPPTLIAPWPVPFSGPRPSSTSNFNSRTVLYVARLEPHKNHLRLLNACEALWQQGLSFKLRLIGCLAYPDAAWRILRRVRGLRKAGYAIQWQAHVSDAELHAAYQACSFTAFPSVLEGFGLPVIESLWHGRPVVCGANGALGEISLQGGCEHVDTQDTGSIADGLRRLLTDEAHYSKLRIAAAARTFRTWNDYWKDVSDFCRADFHPA